MLPSFPSALDDLHLCLTADGGQWRIEDWICHPRKPSSAHERLEFSLFAQSFPVEAAAFVGTMLPAERFSNPVSLFFEVLPEGSVKKHGASVLHGLLGLGVLDILRGTSFERDSSAFESAVSAAGRLSAAWIEEEGAPMPMGADVELLWTEEFLIDGGEDPKARFRLCAGNLDSKDDGRSLAAKAALAFAMRSGSCDLRRLCLSTPDGASQQLTDESVRFVHPRP